MWLIAIFILVPIIEIALFIQIGGLLGPLPTILIILGIAIFGSWVVRTQGALAFADLREAMAQGRDPSPAMAHGALIFFAGLLMITPGFFTDAIGLALMIRPVRSLVLAAIGKRFQVVQTASMTQQWQTRPRDDGAIDAEYHEIDPHEAPKDPSGWTRH